MRSMLTRVRSLTAVTGVVCMIAVSMQAPAQAQAVTLHDQMDNSASTLTNSQNYDSTNDAYDNEAADDFEVPQGAAWTVRTVEVSGQYASQSGTQPTGVNVRIYRDASGLPGTLVKEWLNVQPTGGFGSPNFSNFSIPLSSPPQLAAGRYWISVQADQVSGSHWYWRNRTTVNLNPAAWRNPGGAWGTTCSAWGQRAAKCAPNGELSSTDADQLFRLLGDTTGTSTGGGSVSSVSLDMDADEGGLVNDEGYPGGCAPTASGTAPGRQTTATNELDPSNTVAPANFHRICAAAFASGQTANGGRIAGAKVTFTLTGVGRVFASDSTSKSCDTDVKPADLKTLVVTADAAGYAFACMYSQSVGRTTVTASAGNPAQTSTGTKDWTVSPGTARHIQLCQHDIAGPSCDTTDAFNDPGDEHELTARVTDGAGNPVADVPVEFRETGPAVFTPQGGGSAIVTTDANGLAQLLMTSDVEGESTVVAEISPHGTTGSFRGPESDDDECEEPAGANGQPAAGNCVSNMLTKTWQVGSPTPDCDDGNDNDGDTFTDMDDPGCNGPEDGSEEPVNPRDPKRIAHPRSVSVRFNDGTGARNNGLVVFGRLRARDSFSECIAQQPVNIQRRASGKWVTKKTTSTNRRGRYAVEIFDQASRYRAVAPRTEITDEDRNERHVCVTASKEKRHRHR